jgi:hypothetical protein
MLRRTLLALAPIALLSLAGCGPKWVVLGQANPNPFIGQRAFAVQPIDFANLRVGDKEEAAWLAEKDAEQRGSWSQDKGSINAKFFDSLKTEAAEAGIQIVPATGPSSAPYLIHVRVGWVEPGFYVGVASGPGQVKYEVQITTPDGRPIDAIQVQPAAGGFSTSQRMSTCGDLGGKIVAKYLAERTGQAK